jgi:penicillin-binding protein 2
MFDSTLPKNLRGKKIRTNFKEDIEPQEVLLDGLAQKKEEEIGITEKKFEVPLPIGTLQLLLVFSLVLILVLFAKTFQLQVIDNKEFLAQANENKFIISSIRAERGVIYDKNMEQLISNQPSFDLILDKKNLSADEKGRDKNLKEVAEILGEDFREFKKKIEESPKDTVLVSENLNHQNLIILETKINDLAGFRIEQNSTRSYKDGNIFSQIIGYTGKINSEELKSSPEIYSVFDYVGREGLEKSYEEILRKNPGKIISERDALGNVISKKVVSSPESGKSLVLWLDADLQRKITEELDKVLKSVGSEAGAAIAIDPKTGGVLSLVSIPSFDNNVFNKGSNPKIIEDLLNDPQEPLFDRAIAGGYPTGSTIKPLIASAALEEKIIKPEKEINCQGFIDIPNPYDPTNPTRKSDWAVHGSTDMRKAIAESCDVYFYTVGGGYGNQEGLGPSRIKKYLELFGLGSQTGIDLPGEKKGFIPDPAWKKSYFQNKSDQIWRDGDTYNLAIGQGYLLVSPLQVATSFASIANNGKLLKPQLVKEIIDSDKNVVEEFAPQVLRENFIDPENLQIVREGMREAVTYGSSVTLNDLPVKAASKTGTAEVGNGNYHNWVTVFAPYDDPQIVLTIVIENVERLQAAALPVAKSVLNWYFTK